MSINDVKKEPTMNPNNCSTCEWKAHDDCGHCYMFFDEPTEVCMKHTGRKQRVATINHNRGTINLALMVSSMFNLPPLDFDDEERFRDEDEPLLGWGEKEGTS